VFRQARWQYDKEKIEPLIFELSEEGKIGHIIPEVEKEIKDEIGNPEDEIPPNLRRKDLPELPQVTEVEVVRHYTRLSQMNYGVDLGIYPLGSCTMKYNPKISEKISRDRRVQEVHPLQDERTVQGSLRIMYEFEEFLCKLTGMDAFTLQPSAGAHGEFTGLLIIRKYLKEERGESRKEVIIPDTAHGTNPASAAMAGYKVIVIPSDEEGCVDIEALKEVVSKETAALMLTNPNTLGVFEKNVREISEIVHEVGGLMYYDGANLNAIIGKARPGDMGFDVVHLNLHKTFSTPHGGGGPGSGPIGVKYFLEEYLPVPRIRYDKKEKRYFLDYSSKKTIGKVRTFYGNFSVILKAYVYVLLMGRYLKEVAELSVINSNYLMKKLLESGEYEVKFKSVMHEFVATPKNWRAMDVAKSLLDKGVHAPTVYFPLLVKEAMMVEPTETEPKYELDRFYDAMTSVEKDSPRNTSIDRLDEVKAARNPILSWRMYLEKSGTSG